MLIPTQVIRNISFQFLIMIIDKIMITEITFSDSNDNNDNIDDNNDDNNDNDDNDNKDDIDNNDNLFTDSNTLQLRLG